MSAPVAILLHGLARTRRSMRGLRRAIEQGGFEAWDTTYPSRRMGIEALAAEVAEQIERTLPGREIVAVTHSLGGILVRHMSGRLTWRGAVMIAPPNCGSRLAQRLCANPLYRWFYGPAGQDLACCERWPAPPSPFAVIAGTRGVSLANPVSWLSRGAGVFPASVPNDGTVAVQETVLPGMVAFGTVDATHTWIMDHPTTQRWVLEFLRAGTFDPSSR